MYGHYNAKIVRITLIDEGTKRYTFFSLILTTIQRSENIEKYFNLFLTSS